MNVQERSLDAIAAEPVSRPHRRRTILAVLVAAIVILLSLGYVALRYFMVCGDCSPILCGNPCQLPHFSQRLTNHRA